MAIDPFEQVPLGRTGVRVTRLGFGAAPIGGLYEPFPEADAVATVRHAWAMGIRYFDVAPLYGYGHSERRLGMGLRGEPRDAFTISTKVGRLLVPRDEIAPGADIDRQAFGDHEDWYYRGVDPVRPVWDFSGDGIRRSVEASLARLGTDRVEILFIHDPDEHLDAAAGSAFPALARLREEGVVGAIGYGMNSSEALTWLTERTDPDALLVAGRYTILDQSAIGGLMPLCERRGIGVVIGGVMNSGLLADPKPGATFDYAPADPVTLARAQRLRAICERHGVSLKAAAVQMVFAHPTVATVVAGVRRIAHLDEYPSLYGEAIPAALWAELRHEGLIDERAPLPAGA